MPWDKHPELFKVSALAEQLVRLREMHPTDLASAVEALPDARRRELAEMLHDEQLADVLEEMPEQDQVRLLASLGVERGADVVEEMQPDDAADLLGEMPPEQRERLLAAMETVQAADLRRLLRYDATTAGGLMTSQPLIVPARYTGRRGAGQDPRSADGHHIGRAGLCLRAALGDADRPLPRQRWIPDAAAPASGRTAVGECIEDSGFVRPELSEKEVARRMAAYNLIGVAVCDEDGRLLGAITVDDVLDRILPAGWRKGETT